MQDYKKGGYRYSHQEKEYGKRYKAHYSGDNYNTRVWELEKEVLESIIHKYFRNEGIENFLDFACGTGRVCSFLENKVEKSFGVDISKSMLDIARQECKKTTFFEKDITKDDIFEEKKFDLITAFRFFLNAEDELRRSVLKKIKPLLKKEGYLVFNIHGNKKSLHHLQVLISGRGNEISPDEIRELFNECGFVVQEIVDISFIHEFFSFFPKKLWIRIEKFIRKITFCKEKSIDFIGIAKVNEKT